LKGGNLLSVHGLHELHGLHAVRAVHDKYGKNHGESNPGVPDPNESAARGRWRFRYVHDAVQFFLFGISTQSPFHSGFFSGYDDSQSSPLDSRRPEES